MPFATRSTRSLLLLSLFSLSACGDGTSRPQPPPDEEPQNVTLRGQLSATPGAEPGSPVRLALAWYPTLLSEGTGPMTMPRGIVAQDLAYSGSLPRDYAFELPGAPPSEALVQLGEGMNGKGAVGVLLAYADRNGNATLDTIPADGAPVDRVLGASLAWTQPPAFMVVYLDSAQAPATGLKQGFNLVRITDNLTSDVVPLTTPVPMPLRNDPLLDAFVCEAAWDDTTGEAPCGLPGDEPAEGVLTLGGELSFDGTAADVSLDVRRDGMPEEGAQVTVGGHAATYDAELGRYTLHLDDASALLASGLVTVAAREGDEETVSTVEVPGNFEVVRPTVPMSYSPGEAMDVVWTRLENASRYEVSVVAGDELLASRATREHALKLTPVAHEGTAALRVGVVMESEGFVVRRTREVPVVFTPCDTVTEGSGLTVEGSFLQYAAGIVEWETSEVSVEVKDDGVHVTDAKVMVKGMSVPYLLQQGAYQNGFLAFPGHGLGRTVELRVMRQDAVLCRTLTLPGDFELSLEGQPSRPMGSSLGVSWTRSEGASWYELLLAQTVNEPLYSASTNELEYTFERVDYAGNLSLRFAAVTQPAHNDTLGWMDVKLARTGGATFTQ